MEVASMTVKQLTTNTVFRVIQRRIDFYYYAGPCSSDGQSAFSNRVVLCLL